MADGFDQILEILQAPILNRLDALQKSITTRTGAIMATIEEIQAAQAAQTEAFTAMLAGIAEDVQHIRDTVTGEQAAALDAVLAKINETTASIQAVDVDPSFPPEA